MSKNKQEIKQFRTALKRLDALNIPFQRNGVKYLLYKQNVAYQPIAGGVNLPCLTKDSIVAYIDYDAPACLNTDTITILDGTEMVGGYNNAQRIHLHRKILLPNDLKVIDTMCFLWCLCVKEVKIPSGVQYIGAEAFCFCEALREISIPNGVQEINSYTFFNCTKLQQVTLPETLQTIHRGAFANCKSLTHIRIPSTVTNIHRSAFENCPNLKYIQLPKRFHLERETSTFNWLRGCKVEFY